MIKLEAQTRKDLPHNLAFILISASFYGIGWGFSSFSTIIPLFVSQFTDSAILIGLIPAIHLAGWQLPQLFTASRVARLRRFKPMVVLMAIQERAPYLGLGLVALFFPLLNAQIVLILIYMLLVWHGLGLGLRANPWQNMVAKIIPPENRGTFFGIQAAFANLLTSGAAILAGYTLDLLHSPLDFAVCFFVASGAYAASIFFLGLAREPEDTDKEIPDKTPSMFSGMGEILRRDRNFVWFLVMGTMYQFATMGFAFYIVYGLHHFNMDNITAGFLTATVTGTQIIANAGMGWLSDLVGHRRILIVGMFAISLSSILAWAAPNVGWLYPVFIVSALANVAYWTVGMAMITEFGDAATRPIYIGMANTLIAPATFLAPMIGGWIADFAGYTTTFMVSAVGGLLTALIMIFLVRDPKNLRNRAQIEIPYMAKQSSIQDLP